MTFEQQVTFVYTPEPEESWRFYAEMLGLEMVLDQGQCRIYRTGKNAFLGVCGCGPERKILADGIILTLVSDDVDGVYERLKAKGAHIAEEPKLNPRFNIYHFFLKDPAGYLLEVQTFNDPAWPAPE